GRDAALCFGSLWLGFLFNTAIHEGGHALAANFAGLTVLQVVVPPLDLRREATGFRPRLIQEWMSPFSGRVVFKTQPPITARQQIVMAAGGPVANLALVLALVAVIPFGGFTPEMLSSPGIALIAACLGGALWMGLSNLVPFRHPV